MSKLINVKDVVKGLEEAKSSVDFGYFLSDREPVEFVSSDYDEVFLVDTDNSSFNKSDTSLEMNGERYNRELTDKFVETAIGITDTGTEIVFTLLVGTTSVYGGEKEVAYMSQILSLAGLNKFTKEVDKDLSEYYNTYLNYEGFAITIDDVLTAGEFNTQYNVTILSWTDEDAGNKYWITVNSRKQLSKITVKGSGRKVVPKGGSVGSAFA